MLNTLCLQGGYTRLCIHRVPRLHTQPPAGIQHSLYAKLYLCVPQVSQCSFSYSIYLSDILNNNFHLLFCGREGVGMCPKERVCGRHRTTYGSHCSLSTMWVLETELRSPSLEPLLRPNLLNIFVSVIDLGIISFFFFFLEKKAFFIS